MLHTPIVPLRLNGLNGWQGGKLTGDKYRELLKKLELNKALECQMHKGFKSDFSHGISKYEREYLPGSSSARAMPPPLTEDLSHLCDPRKEKSKQAITNYWKNMTPEQRAIQIAKRKESGSKWRSRATENGTIEMRHFVTPAIIKQTKTKKTNAKPDRKSSTKTPN